jgi:hypothetical protein
MVEWVSFGGVLTFIVGVFASCRVVYKVSSDSVSFFSLSLSCLGERDTSFPRLFHTGREGDTERQH